MFDDDDSDDDEPQKDSKYDDLLKRLEEAKDEGIRFLVRIMNKKSKEYIKGHFESWDTNRLEDLWHNYFEGMEQYEICAALKEVIEDRYNDSNKRKEYGDKKVKEEMDSVAFSQNAFGNNVELGHEWDGIKEAILDKAVNESFFRLYPTKDMLKLEINRFKARNIQGKISVLEWELKGNPEVDTMVGLKGKFNNVYEQADLEISIEDNKISLTFRDEDDLPWLLEYIDFELVTEEMQ
jgi:hypothetical protein